jgi:hypothetical protein
MLRASPHRLEGASKLRNLLRSETPTRFQELSGAGFTENRFS